MLSPSRLWRRVRALFTSSHFDAELDEEMRFHLDMEIRRHVSDGMSERDARALAMRTFGGLGRHRDDARDSRGIRPVEDFTHDVRIAVRSLLRQRTFAVVAIATLAIGIGATTALWSAVYRVLIAPYPFAQADRIVVLFSIDQRRPLERDEVSPADFLDWKERARSFELLAAAEPWQVDWIGPEGPERFSAALVTTDAFPIQGLRPLLGRTFAPEEFQPGRNTVVLLSEEVWRNRFGADSSVVGRVLVLDSIPHAVIGVMPADALSPYDAEVWLPRAMRGNEGTLRRGYWTVMGRLASGVTLAQAQGEMDRIAGELATQFPGSNRNRGVSVLPLREAIAGGARRQLLVLFGAVAFVLLIACVNVANLQLAESVRRRRELAIRTAIGAGRGRLTRQLLTEGLVLSLAGAAAGIAIAAWGISVIRGAAPDDLWQLKRLSLDGAALWFALGVAALTSLVISAMPVVAAGRLQLSRSLAAGARAGMDRARRRAHRALVVAEVALALVLLVGAGLLLRSFASLLQVESGFRTTNILVTTVQAWGYYPTPQHRAEFVRTAVERLGALPGVEGVGMTSSLPLDYPIGFDRASFRIEGQSYATGDELPAVRVAAVSPGYLDVLDVPLLQGRALGPSDLEGSVPVVVVNDAFARQYFPEGNAIGSRVAFGFMSAPIAREIVGVVGDMRHDGLEAAPAPAMFVPHAQAATGAIRFVMRTAGAPGAAQRAVRTTLLELNAAMPIAEQVTMDALLARSLRERRFQLGLLAAFSGVALTLALVGIYGVASRAAAERTHEIGVRMAMGARAGDVRWMMLRSAAGMTLAGVAAGVLVAMLVTRAMAGMLYGIAPLDPATYGASAVLLLAASLVATFVPAVRASTVDPVRALRNE